MLPDFGDRHKDDGRLSAEWDRGTKGMVDEIKASQRKYSSSFNSSVPRFGPPGTLAGSVYNIDCGNKRTVASEMKHSPRKYNTCFSQTPRSPTTRGRGVDKFYDSDHNTIAKSIQESPRSYRGVFASTIPRFGVQSKKNDSVVTNKYLEDFLAKFPTLRNPRSKSGVLVDRDKTALKTNFLSPDYKSVGKEVEESSMNYSSFRSKTPRFKKPRPPPESGSLEKRDMSYEAEHTPRTYRGIFGSTTKRFTDPPDCKTWWGTYDVNSLTLVGSVEASPNKYSVQFKGKSPRASWTPRDINDKFYDYERLGPKESMTNHASHSALNYSSFKSNTPRMGREDHPLTIDLDYEPARPMSHEVQNSPREYSVFRSPIGRFNAGKKEKESLKKDYIWEQNQQHAHERIQLRTSQALVREGPKVPAPPPKQADDATHPSTAQSSQRSPRPAKVKGGKVRFSSSASQRKGEDNEKLATSPGPGQQREGSSPAGQDIAGWTTGM